MRDPGSPKVPINVPGANNPSSSPMTRPFVGIPDLGGRKNRRGRIHRPIGRICIPRLTGQRKSSLICSTMCATGKWSMLNQYWIATYGMAYSRQFARYNKWRSFSSSFLHAGYVTASWILVQRIFTQWSNKEIEIQSQTLAQIWWTLSSNSRILSIVCLSLSLSNSKARAGK